MYANFEIMYAHHKLILDKRRPKKTGLFPVKIRITFNRQQRYYNVGVDLSEEDFERLLSHSVRKELRPAKLKIQQFETRVRNTINSLSEFSFEDFQYAFEVKKKKPSKNELFQLFEEIINDLNNESRFSTASAYQDAYSSLKKFKPKLKLREITVDFLRDYEAHMKAKGRSISTIGIYLRHVRATYNKAIENGLIDQKHYPFGKNKYQIKSPRNIKKALSLEQIKAIMDYEIKPGSTQHFARDMWLFSYLCNGMNMKDVVNLKYFNLKGDTIEYDRAKTSRTIQNPKPIVITLLPRAIEIIEEWGNKDQSDNNYIFPVLNNDLNDEEKHTAKYFFLKTVNKYMKRIGKEVGYDKSLTTYAARHSFATILKRSGAPMELISESLGHKSLKTTEAYLDSFEDKTRRKFMENLIPK